MQVIQFKAFRVAKYEHICAVHQALFRFAEIQQVEVFQIVAQGVADAALNGFGALIGVFNNLVTAVINVIGVITGTTDQGVGTGNTVENVVAAIANNFVIQRVASAVDVIAL